MTDQPNPYSQPEESSGVPIGENGIPKGQRRIWFWLAMGCVVPLALIGLLGIALMIYIYYEAMYSGI
ncbi:hypothetical protein N9B24_01570 [bacterium]|nr:hypothetical protein [bacterium]MDB4446003.1 hypothetical protein [bacterium]MDB4476930.1 hypothetical protein [Rhodopirellula sp.]MDB4558043.1 hypothetical protein [bacterium]